MDPFPGDRLGWLKRLIKFNQEGFHPSDPQNLTDPPSFLAVPDPKAFPIKPDLDGFNMPAGSDRTAQPFDGFAVINEAEVRADPFHIDLDHLRFHALILSRSLERQINVSY
jgi:hypothetical protein